jgi:hypothetical protein
MVTRNVGYFEETKTIGRGYAPPSGIPKNACCEICNLPWISTIWRKKQQQSSDLCWFIFILTNRRGAVVLLYRVHPTWAGFELTTLVVIGTDWTGSWIHNYHTITTTTAPRRFVSININQHKSLLCCCFFPQIVEIHGKLHISQQAFFGFCHYKRHHVTIILTSKLSPCNTFCQQYLLPLNIFSNPYLCLCTEKQPRQPSIKNWTLFSTVTL